MIEFTDIRIRSALPLHPYLAYHTSLSVRLLVDEHVCGETSQVTGDLTTGIWTMDSGIRAHTVNKLFTLAVFAGEKGVLNQLVSVTLSVTELLARVKTLPNGICDIEIFDSCSIQLKLIMTCSVKVSSMLDDISSHVEVQRRPFPPESAEHAYLLGMALSERFQESRDSRDIDMAISHFQRAVDFTNDGNADKGDRVSGLGIALQLRYERRGDFADMEKAILFQQQALSLTPDGHASLPARLSNMSRALSSRFNLKGTFRDLQDMITCLQKELELTPDDLPRKPIILKDLGTTLQRRFEILGSPPDLEDAISSLRKAVKLMPDGHSQKAGALSNLGSVIAHRFEVLGDLRDMKDAVATQQKATELTPDDDPHKPTILSNLGRALRNRFERLGSLTDIEDAISHLQKAVELTLDGNPNKPSRLGNLSNVLQSRFEHLGNLADIEDAISNLRKAVDLTPDGHPAQPYLLNSLGNALNFQFERLGSIKDIEDAISSLQKAVELTPDGHPDKSGRLSNLGNVFQSRFERLGSLFDLGDAISSLRKAVKLMSDGHPQKAGALSNLGSVLARRFGRLGNLADIEDAISSLQKAVVLTPDGHHEKRSRLNNLGNALTSRFERLGDLKDIEDAISNLQNAVELTLDDHPEKPNQLSSLGIVLERRFRYCNGLVDIEDSISNLQKAIELTPDGHPDMPIRLNNLSNVLQSRFERLGSVADIEDAISTQQRVVELTPDGHPARPGTLSNLGNALQSRFERLGDLIDIEDAISNLRKAVKLTPDGHPEKPNRLSNLGIALQFRFERLSSLEDINDIDDAISSLRKAVDLTPDGHPDQSGLLNNLGKVLQSRFQRLGSLTDIEDAISSLQKAVELMPIGYPDRAVQLSNLGRVLVRNFELFHVPKDLENAMSALSAAANATSGEAMVRFTAARLWAKTAETYSRSPIDAFGRAIDLLPRIAWLGLAVTDQHALLADIGDLVRDAVAAAIKREEYETAVVWAEQGRSVVWQNLLGLRNPVDDLQASHPKLAVQLKTIARQLEGSWSHDIRKDKVQMVPVEDVARKYSKLAIEWENMVENIRKLPDFNDFMRAKTFRQLASAADEGPVVILNVNDSRCDALVLIADDSKYRRVSTINIPLESFSYEKSKSLFRGLTDLLTPGGFRARINRQTGWAPSSADGEAKLKGILHALWRDVVKPVIEVLAFQVQSTRPPRIWWCATSFLAFLPIHAAGIYNTQEVGKKLSDYVVSSYTPTLTAILDSSDPIVREDFQVLTVAQSWVPWAQNVEYIPKTEDEVLIVQGIAAGARMVNLTKENATVKRVLGGMMESHWIHLACHGQQNRDDPMKSGFLLHDDILKLSEIIKVSLPKADFAFLSACQTATGEEKIAEESVHLAAGMFLSGCRGVIATTWSVRDEDGPKIAEEVYGRMFKDGKPNRKEAAYALHEAIKRLRESGVKCTSWVPFIHIGR